ncbi:MAG: hypothetical protein LAN59_01950 [Acidobacteriia bacterium]|nr:hypothetical protein [Terriglobia bacterium]
MIQLIFFLLLGALLLASLFFLARRRPRIEGGAQAMVEARQALSALQSGLLPRELVERIFAREDLEYVASHAPPPVHKLFLDERKQVALSWARQVRAAILHLRRFYLGKARLYAGLEFRTELELAIDFALLLFACRVLELVVYWRGPYAAGRMVGSTTLAAARICAITEQALAFLNPPASAVAVHPMTGSQEG